MPNLSALEKHSWKHPLCRLFIFPTLRFRLSKIMYSIVGQQQHRKQGKQILFWQQLPSIVQSLSPPYPRIWIEASAHEKQLPATHQHPTLSMPKSLPLELVTVTSFSRQGIYSRQHLNQEHFYLQLRSATATSWLNSRSLAQKGRLHTHTTRETQSEVSLMQPFLLATLKLGSASEMAYSLEPSQKQQKMLCKQSGSCSSKQYLPSSFPEPTLASPRIYILLFSSITL